MAQRICLGCGIATDGNRCPSCRRVRDAESGRSPERSTYRWHRLARTIIARHVRMVGPWCPGDERHERHVSTDLTVDHIVPVARGGAMFDRANLRVLCRSANSARGARHVA